MDILVIGRSARRRGPCAEAAAAGTVVAPLAVKGCPFPKSQIRSGR